MFAVIKTGGKQYKVEKGSKFEVEKLTNKEGEKFTIEKVLLIKNDEDLKVGTPLVEGAYVEAKVISHKKGDKQIIFKKKAKKRYQRTHGYRKELTVIEILEIHATGGKGVKAEEKATEAAPKAKPTKKAPAKKPAVKKPAAKKHAPSKKAA